MKKSETILFFGNERLATGVKTDLPVLKALVQSGYLVKAIVTVPASPVRSRKPRVSEVAAFARANDIPLLEYDRLLPEIARLSAYGAAAGVLAAYGKIVPEEIINIFPRGIINLHPSLLPKHRGPTPIESAILSGESDTGISLMKLVKEMDAGPVYHKAKIHLTGKESKQYLSDTLGKLGAKQLIKLLPDILSGKLEPKPQPEENVSYDKRLASTQGVLAFSKPAYILEREIRAFAGWPRSKTTVNQTAVVVTAAHVQEGKAGLGGSFCNLGGELAISTLKGWLIIDRLVPAGGKEMSGSDFLNGYRI